MTTKMQVTIIAEYDLPEGDELAECYGTDDPVECAAIDEGNLDPAEALEFADIKFYAVTARHV